MIKMIIALVFILSSICAYSQRIYLPKNDKEWNEAFQKTDKAMQYKGSHFDMSVINKSRNNNKNQKSTNRRLEKNKKTKTGLNDSLQVNSNRIQKAQTSEVHDKIQSKKLEPTESSANSPSIVEPISINSIKMITKRECKKISDHKWFDGRCLTKKEIVLAKANKKIAKLDEKEKRKSKENNYCSVIADSIGDYSIGTILDKKAAKKFKKMCKKQKFLFDYNKELGNCSCQVDPNFCSVVDPVGRFAPKERLDNLKRIKKYEKQCKKIKGNFEFKRDGNSCHCVRS